MTPLKLLSIVLSVAFFAQMAWALEDYVEGKVAKRVFRLKKENFKRAIRDPANPVTLIMFGAYWCGHCKKLGPILETAAPQVAGKMAIGKVDCTEEKKLCDKHKIRGYPTLKFSVDGQVMDYTLGRTEEDIVSFAERLSRPKLQLVDSVAAAMKFATDQTFDHGVAFVCHDPNTQPGTMEQMSEKSSLLQVCAQAARKHIAHAYFAALPADADVSSITGEAHEPTTNEEGEPVKVEKHGFACRLEKGIAPRCLHGKNVIIDTDTLVDFVKVNNVATVTELGPENFHRIGRLGRPLVIGVADINEDDQVAKVTTDLHKFGVNGPSNFLEKYYLGWMDGVKWAKFLEQFDVKQDELPQFFVLDVPKRKYWHNIEYKDKTILELLTAIKDGDIEPRESGGVRGGKFLGRLANGFYNWLPWSLFLLLGLVAAVVVAVVPDGNDLRPPHKDKKSSGGSATTDPLLGKKDN